MSCVDCHQISDKTCLHQTYKASQHRTLRRDRCPRSRPADVRLDCRRAPCAPRSRCPDSASPRRSPAQSTTDGTASLRPSTRRPSGTTSPWRRTTWTAKRPRPQRLWKQTLAQPTSPAEAPGPAVLTARWRTHHITTCASDPTPLSNTRDGSPPLRFAVVVWIKVLRNVFCPSHATASPWASTASASGLGMPPHCTRVMHGSRTASSWPLEARFAHASELLVLPDGTVVLPLQLVDLMEAR